MLREQILAVSRHLGEVDLQQGTVGHHRLQARAKDTTRADVDVGASSAFCLRSDLCNGAPAGFVTTAASKPAGRGDTASNDCRSTRSAPCCIA